MVDFEKYHVSEISKDLFLPIRAVLTYAKDKKGLIKEVPNFDSKFQKKKKAKVAKVCYLQEDRQRVWLNVCEKDKRSFALLFATLLQTGMRPKEGCGLKWKSIHFNQNKVRVESAYKDITLYDDEMNITGHIMTDGDLKTTDFYYIHVSENGKKEKSSQTSLRTVFYQMVCLEGFGKPRPKNSPLDYFYLSSFGLSFSNPIIYKAKNKP